MCLSLDNVCIDVQIDCSICFSTKATASVALMVHMEVGKSMFIQ